MNHDHASMSISSTETLLSDVHVGIDANPFEVGTVISRFQYVLTGSGSGVASYDHSSLDDDGDLVVPRRTGSGEIKLFLIEHAMSTKLSDVGQQIWRGALVLADFLLHRRKTFEGSVVLELGGGVGLLSIVASQFCSTVFCTDTGKSILDICRRNVERNEQQTDGCVLIRELNWQNPFVAAASNFQWQCEDEKRLKEVQYILAADVIYDDGFTDSFMQCLVLLNHSKLKEPAVIYVAIEKRINFTLEEMAPAVPAYKHFRVCLERVYVVCGHSIKIEAEEVDLEQVQKFLEYDRVNEMELWKLETSKCT